LLKTKLVVFILFVSCVRVTYTLFNEHRRVPQCRSLTAVTNDHPCNITWLYLYNLTIRLHLINILTKHPDDDV